ncbi:translation initiation factor 2 [Pseudomonas sp. NA-150]|uniref:translation initiation factor 2 n=1 Tax=Pseudomonas sp. NA-150 TaxID=3367525 RepID=UPI0037CC5528
MLAPIVEPAPFKELAREPVHELAPSVPVVPVVVTTTSFLEKRSTVGKADKPAREKGKSEVAPTPVKDRASVASKSKPAAQMVQQTHLPRVPLDLSLPSSMAEGVQPVGKVEPIVRKSVLPQLLGEKKTTKDSPFQLNGRLLSNEMQLQLRNEARQSQIDGAALEFEFKQ